MLVTVLRVWTAQVVVPWAMKTADDLHYGYPRTTQEDHVVGHEQGGMPSHFVAMNVQGQITVVELPGGNLRGAQLLVGPRLLGKGADLALVRLHFVGDGKHPDLVVRGMRQDWEHRDQSRCASTVLATTVSILRAPNQRHEGIQPLTEKVTLSLQGNKSSYGTTMSKELANFIEGTTETCCRREVSKPTHGIITLFDTTMILFQKIVEIVIAPMENITTKGLANGT
jgi:hypothetical protein